MEFSIVFAEFLKVCSNEVIGTQDRLAENPSLYSDRINWNLPKWIFTNSNRCIATLLLISIRGLNLTNEVQLRNQVLQKCNQNHSDQKWKQILEFSKIEPFAVGKVLDYYLKNFGTPEDLFGNVLPLMKKINKLWFFTEIDRESTKKAKPVNTSEYKDKGSRRPNHVVPKFLGNREIETRQETIELPMRNGTNFFSQIVGLDDSVRTLRERRLLQEEEQIRIQKEITKIRKRLRSPLKVCLNLLKQDEGSRDFVQARFEDLEEINHILNIKLFINSLKLLKAEIQDQQSSVEDSFSSSQLQQFQTHYRQFDVQVDEVFSSWPHY